MGQVPPGNRSMILPTEAAIEEEPADLVDDDELWRHQASSLAVFVTPAAGTTFRLPEPARRDGRGVRTASTSSRSCARSPQYARQIDQALRPLPGGFDMPPILAAAEPMDAIFRSVNSYPHLVADGLPGNPDTTSDAELVARARRLLDDIYAAELDSVKETYALRASQRRTSADIADVARAATHGLVETVLVDIDEVVPG